MISHKSSDTTLIIFGFALCVLTMTVGIRATSLLSGTTTENDQVEVDSSSKQACASSTADDGSVTVSSTCTGSSSSVVQDGVSTTSSSSRVDRLHQEYPAATREEVERCLSHCHDEATAREYLEFLLEWRDMYGHWKKSGDTATSSSTCKSPESQAQDWELAWELVWQKSSTPSTELYPPLPKDIHASTKAPSKVYTPKKMTQYVYMHQHPSNPQLMLIQFLPACIDVKGASPEQHSLAFHLFLDLQLNRTDPHQKVLFAFDTRGNTGWPNYSFFSLRPIIAGIPHLLVCLQTGRLEKMIFFPIPGWASAFFDTIKMALPKVVRERVQLLPGNPKNMDAHKVAQMAGVHNELFQQMIDQRDAIQYVS